MHTLLSSGSSSGCFGTTLVTLGSIGFGFVSTSIPSPSPSPFSCPNENVQRMNSIAHENDRLISDVLTFLFDLCSSLFVFVRVDVCFVSVLRSKLLLAYFTLNNLLCVFRFFCLFNFYTKLSLKDICLWFVNINTCYFAVELLQSNRRQVDHLAFEVKPVEIALVVCHMLLLVLKDNLA